MSQHVEDRHTTDGMPVFDRRSRTNCPFCRIVQGVAPARVVREWEEALAITPHGGGVTQGHVLVLPKTHVPDVAADPAVSAVTMRHAAELAGEVGDCNVITSRGAAATQTVRHLHVHVVPRRTGDGILLPWTTPRAVSGSGRGGRERRPWTVRRAGR
ncbi:HIT domain-containing protein [Streptomyces sp. NPDC050997]|uniref:HIT family protein n=1 Tax=Streptomyces sp. NPDC050997 TaxID=3155519 RepID=UPI003419BFDB